MLYKYRKYIIITLIVLFVLSLTGCKNLISSDSDDSTDNLITQDIEDDFEIITEDENYRPTVLYYRDLDGYIVPVMRRIPWEEGIARKTLSALVNSPAIRMEAAEMGLYPVLPEGTEVLGISIRADEGDLAKVDFSRDILNYNSAAEENIIVTSVVYTLTEFPTIKKVQFMIEGAIPGELTYGTDVSKPITRQDINLELSSSDVDLDTSSKVMVYYYGQGSDDFTYFVPVTRVVSALTPNIETALNELLKGPKSYSGLNSALPEGLAISGIQVRDGTAYISFTLQDGYTDGNIVLDDKALKAVMLTVREFESVGRVKFIADDDNIIFQEIQELEQPLAVPTFANEY